MAVFDEVESPPPTKKMHYSVKQDSDSSDSNGSGNSSGNSDSSSESSSDSSEEEEEIPKGKDKSKIKKETMKVQMKDMHCKAENAKCKQSVHHDKGPKTKRRKQSIKEELPVKVHKSTVKNSGF